ncbi:helix-turn-helix transcriptional regulator [Bacillus sp. FJAT-49711]|uniref:AraC family transcriptional regulator n=1 Tax=Bacillus sp. FJAT-49711 TaxID=2833585 RepID=UPI001BC8E419|nr:AraC family transcriptional regulator [Bacillus sp. FJAT-49711]MBS4219258.1 helix-turn-helix transcriptional regulator [Bacillus sp. FJAT-49711]
MSITSIFHPELMQENYFPKVNAYYFKQWEDYEMDYHVHKDVEIMYVINGECIVETLSESISLKKGDFILLDSNIPHRLIVGAEQPCRMLNVEFSFIERSGSFPSIREMALENTALSEFLQMNIPYLILKDPNEIYHTLKNLVLESDKKEDKQIMVHLLLSQLLIQIARMAVEDRKIKKENQQANLYVNQTIEFLHHNYDRDLKLEDIGRAVNLHPGYLHRIFKKIMNCTIMEYLSTLRMEKAKALLAHTDIPIIEISQYIGINSSQYFSQLFKRHASMTPVDFRRTFSSHVEKYRS